MLGFEDAWVKPQSLKESLTELPEDQVLQDDVMTPLRPDYYQGKGDPTDCLNPVIVPFLSVQGTLQFAIRPETSSEEGRKWARVALQLCRQALGNWGIGGKTRAGYGRMRSARAPR